MTKPNYQGLFNGCVGYWDFNGDAKDCIGGNDGDVSGATLTTNHLGMTDSAYSFEGNDYVEINSSVLQSSEFTISFWEYTNNGNLGYFLSDSNDVENLLIRRYNLGLYIGVYVGYEAISYIACDNEKWNFITVKRESNGDFSIYVNAILKDTDNSSFSGLNNNLYLGNRQDLERDFDGKIAYPMIWNRALTDNEILALYNLTKYKPIYPYMRRTCQR